MALFHAFTNPQPDGTNTQIVRPIDWNSAHVEAYTLSGNVAGNSSVSGTNVVLQAGNNVTLSGTGSTVVIQAAGGGAGGGIAAAAGTQTGTTGTVVFANSNGLTFGMSGSSQVTASHNGLTSQSNQALSAGNGSFAFQTASFSNANGISFSTSAGSAIVASHNGITSQTVQTQNMVSVLGSTGNISFANGNGITFGGNASTVTASHNGLTSQSNQAFSADGGSSAFQTLNFRNANGISFSNSNGSVQASYTVPTQTNQTVGVYAVSNTTGASSSSTVDARSISFQGAGVASVGMSNGSVVISVPSGGGGGDGGNVLAAGTQTANTTGTVLFQDGNGVTFGMNNSSVITATVKTDYQSSNANYLTSQSNQAVSAANGSYAFQTLSLSNANGISFGTSAGSAITASHNALTSQSNQAFSAAGGSSAFQTLGFSDNAAASFTNTNGSVGVASVRGSFFATSNTTQGTSGTQNLNAVTFQGNGIVSVGLSNGSVVLSATQSNQAFSASGGSTTFQTLNFANSNGLTFSNSNGSVVASYTVPTQSAQSVGGYAVGNTTAQSSSSTLDARSFSIQGAGAASVGFSNGSWVVSAPSAAAGNVTFSAGANSAGLASLVFSNSNGVSFGLNGSTITASAAGGGGGFSAGMSNLGDTAGTSGTVGSQVVFVGTNGIQLSQSVNGASATVSILPDFASEYIYPGVIAAPISTFGQGTLTVQYVNVPSPVQATRFDFHVSVGQSTAANTSVNTINLSQWVGIYTRNGATLSSIASASTTTQLTWSSNVTSLLSGQRQISIPVNVTMTPGVYYVGLALSTQSTNGTMAMSMIGNTLIASTHANYALLGAASTITSNVFQGMGIFSATTNAVRDSIALSQISQTGTNALRANIMVAFRG